MFSLPDEFYMFSFELRVFQFLGPPSPPFDTGGDTRPTSLAGHLRESFTCWKLSCGTLHVRALQGKDLFGIPHAYGGKRRCALKPLCACRLLLRKHENKNLDCQVCPLSRRRPIQGGEVTMRPGRAFGKPTNTSTFDVFKIRILNSSFVNTKRLADLQMLHARQ